MMFEELKKANRVVGVKQLVRALDAGDVERVYIAADADDHVKQTIKEALESSGVTVVAVDSKEALGKACNIDVDAACAAILK